MKDLLNWALLFSSLILGSMFFLPYFGWFLGDKGYELLKAFDIVRYHHVLSALSFPLILTIWYLFINNKLFRKGD